eukprot:CAMPEP_0197463978 /NCGR_PEP_ID=MMETSP1175-20131217/63270_1 /TAXON_ID=1003142 /ORGANISM="Triceratium dubium, Strain CCMP147" /LENGTH=36 /DNA_ID= /DNA_START= /DNA_END= /DNA_ORIENTATION=
MSRDHKIIIKAKIFLADQNECSLYLINQRQSFVRLE